jgi:RND family efflux transporter MFP subunit
MKKLIFVFIIGAALVWFGMDYYKKNNTSDKKVGGRGASRQVVVAVETGSVTKGDMNDEGIFTGSIQPKSKFQVAPKTSGRIKKVNFDIGDTIKNGDIVAELDDEEFILAVEQAEAALEIAKANYNESGELLEISKRELERVKTMRKQKVASEVEVENASADYKTRSAKHMVNKSSLRQAEASLAQAKLKLAYTKVDASWSYGVNDRFVSERLLDEGAMITANTPIISVIDITNLTVVIDVVERDYFKIKPGMEVNVFPTALPGATFTAKVTRIAPMLDEVSRQARIELNLKNPEFELKPGMFITAKIIYGTHKNTTIVPIEALVVRKEKEGVFIVDEANKVAKFVPVECGYRNPNQVEICYPELSGRVVTLGQHLLEDGMSIRIPSDETKTNGSEAKK